MSEFEYCFICKIDHHYNDKCPKTNDTIKVTKTHKSKKSIKSIKSDKSNEIKNNVNNNITEIITDDTNLERKQATNNLIMKAVIANKNIPMCHTGIDTYLRIILSCKPIIEDPKDLKLSNVNINWGNLNYKVECILCNVTSDSIFQIKHLDHCKYYHETSYPRKLCITSICKNNALNNNPQCIECFRKISKNCLRCGGPKVDNNGNAYSSWCKYC